MIRCYYYIISIFLFLVIFYRPILVPALDSNIITETTKRDPLNNKNIKQKKIKKTSSTNYNKKEKQKPLKSAPAKQTIAPQPTSKDVADILYPDEIGEKVSHLVVGLANRLDSFFGEARSDDESNGSTLRLIPSYTYYDKRPSVTELGVNLNLKLLNLEAKAKNLETKIRKGLEDTTKGFGDEPEENKQSNIKRKTVEQENWHFNFESKLASRPAIYYSGKIRARRNFEKTFFLHHFAFSAGWDTDDSWSQKTSLFSDHALSEFMLFRFINELNWFITNKLIETSHGPSLIQTINKYNNVSYNFRVSLGTEKNILHHLSSSYSINFRHGTPSKRIFIDLIPMYSYPRVENYKEIRSIELRMEYFFGDIK